MVFLLSVISSIILYFLIFDPKFDNKALSCLVYLNNHKKERPTKEDSHQPP